MLDFTILVKNIAMILHTTILKDNYFIQVNIYVVLKTKELRMS